jgi:hypothetical protein
VLQLYRGRTRARGSLAADGNSEAAVTTAGRAGLAHYAIRGLHIAAMLGAMTAMFPPPGGIRLRGR